ncbi:adhesin protein Mad1 [Purpureocillium lavendulum]|uniref:Adhesin protein Mad1 n=1 Tax=Purpureocillium lavendulum TaxID=1247861 RepID=A0AB34G1W7_9HYPO|nr:adhesin protein Mad1 [Purpureocillium lavendulum]
MKPVVALLAFAAGIDQASATFGKGLIIGDAIRNLFDKTPTYSCPSIIDNKCVPEWSAGVDFADVAIGKLINFKKNILDGFSCEADFFKQLKVSVGKGITGQCTPKREECPSISPDASTGIPGYSIDKVEVSTEFDARIELHYLMRDNSICKTSHDCSKSGTTISNTQCGGAKKVWFVFPGLKGKKKCKLGIHKIHWHCKNNQPKPSTSSVVTFTKPGQTNTKTVPGTDTTVTQTGPGETNTKTLPGKSTTVTQTAPGETNTKTIPGESTTVTQTGPGETNTKTVPGESTTVTQTGPGETNTQTVPGSGTTVTQTGPGETNTKTIPGKSTTVTQTGPGETNTQTTPGQDSTVTVPGGQTSVTQSQPGVTSTQTIPGKDTTTTGPGQQPSTTQTGPGESTQPGQSTPGQPTPTTETTTYMTTSTVFTTSVTTITSCAPEIPNCPAKSTGGTAVVTVTVPVSTTICPVTEVITKTNPGGVPGTTVAPPSGSAPGTTVAPPSGSSPGPQPTGLPCPEVAPGCLNTWALKFGCKGGLDLQCVCPNKDLVKEVYGCIASYGKDSDAGIAAMFIQGLCIKWAPSNPEIGKGPDAVSSVITITGTPTVGIPVTDTTMVVTQTAGTETTTVTTVLTNVPIVSVVPTTGGPEGPGSTSGPAPTEGGPAENPGATTFLSTPAITGTGAPVPSATGEVPVTAGASRIGASLGLGLAVVAAVAAF